MEPIRTRTRRPSPTHVPTTPFAKRIQKWIARETSELDEEHNGGDYAHNGLVHPVTYLIGEIFPELTLESGRRRLYDLINETVDWIPFDRADRILCFVEGSFAWHWDPELSEIYQSVNLLQLDLLSPTSDAAYADALSVVRRTFGRVGGAQKTATALGLDYRAVRTYLAAPAAA